MPIQQKLTPPVLLFHVFAGWAGKNRLCPIPAGTRRQNNVDTTSFQRFDVVTTSIQRRFNVLCQLESCLLLFFFSLEVTVDTEQFSRRPNDFQGTILNIIKPFKC